MSNDVLIQVDGACKKFCRSLKKSLWYGLSDVAHAISPFGSRHKIPNGNRALRPDEFWAVDDVSFELRRGECLGLIGRNGAGKTTLLKMLNGLIKPDRGRIEMRGRVGGLIALGAGFNPILTGRENIYVNGSVIGLTKKETDAKMEEIIEFADIRDFIDSPVQSYSSGMHVRLGFAIASTLQPDVLLLDEVLAVGDAGFRHKCYSRIGQLQKMAAVIFVSHNIDFIAQICDRVVHMNRGKATLYEDVMDGIAAYNKENEAAASDATARYSALYPPINNAEFDLSKHNVCYGDHIEVTLMLDVQRAFDNPVVTFLIRNESGMAVAMWNTLQHQVLVEIPASRSELHFVVGPLWLLPGRYYCSMSIREKGSAEHNLWLHNQVQFVVTGPGKPMTQVAVLLPYQGHTLKRFVKHAQSMNYDT